MNDGERKPQEHPSLMATVAAIVEAVLDGQGLTLFTPKPSPWKAAHRDEMVRSHERPVVGWGRLSA